MMQKTAEEFWSTKIYTTKLFLYTMDKRTTRQIEEHIETNKEVIFFTYRTIDNYFNHFFYNIWEEGIEDKDKKFVKTKDINEVPSQLLDLFLKDGYTLGTKVIFFR